MKQHLAPFLSIIAFVARVVPWIIILISDGFIFNSSSNSNTPFITASSGFAAEVKTFFVKILCFFSRTISVKVPPISIANLI